LGSNGDRFVVLLCVCSNIIYLFVKKIKIKNRNNMLLLIPLYKHGLGQIIAIPQEVSHEALEETVESLFIVNLIGCPPNASLVDVRTEGHT